MKILCSGFCGFFFITFLVYSEKHVRSQAISHHLVSLCCIFKNITFLIIFLSLKAVPFYSFLLLSNDLNLDCMLHRSFCFSLGSITWNDHWNNEIYLSPTYLLLPVTYFHQITSTNSNNFNVNIDLQNINLVPK